LQLNEIDYGEAVPIDGYGEGYFRIAGQAVKAPLLVNAKGAKSWSGFDDAQTVLEFCRDIDVLFVGTGSEIAHIPHAFRSVLEAAGIGVELMNSASASRTYNVLLSEDRRVAAALLPIESV